jgi:DNA polymerase-4
LGEAGSARKIIHLDLDAFFCAVEEIRDPSLVGKPFAVGGRPDERGVVSSCSYAARKYGVHSAMPMSQALKSCPRLQVITPDHHSYSQISRQVMQRLHEFTPLIEQISIDEAFMDVSDLSNPPDQIAKEVQKSIHEEFGLPCSIGLASNKLVAKIATDFGKAAARGDKPPNAITIVPPGHEAIFLEPLPVEALWGVGPKTAAKLATLGVHNIGDLSRFPVEELVKFFGKNGYELSIRSHGIDDRPLTTEHEPKSISQETTFSKDIADELQLKAVIQKQCSSVAKQLKNAAKQGTTIKLKIRWPDFRTVTRQVTLKSATNQEEQIFTAALKLFEEVWQRGRLVRLIGVGVTGFNKPIQQLGLWDSKPPPIIEEDEKLKEVVESLQKRYGKEIVLRGIDFKKNHSSQG